MGLLVQAPNLAGARRPTARVLRSDRGGQFKVTAAASGGSVKEEEEEEEKGTGKKVKIVIRVLDPVRERRLPPPLFSAPETPAESPAAIRRPEEDGEERWRYYVNMGYAIRTLREELPDVFCEEPSLDIYRTADKSCKIQTSLFEVLSMHACEHTNSSNDIIRDSTPLLNQMEQRLASYSSFARFGVKIKVVKSVLSSLLTYYLGTLKLPDGLKEYFDRAWRICLWGKYEATGYCLSLQQHRSILNEALLLKFFPSTAKTFHGSNLLGDITKTRSRMPPARLVILDQKSIMKLNSSCRSIVRREVAYLDTTLLWHDSWNNDPLAYSLARDCSSPLYDSISVAEAAEA